MSTPTQKQGTAHRIDRKCFRIRKREQYLVENRTPYDIEIINGDDELFVPALAARKMSGRRLKVFEHELVQFRQRHRLRVTLHQDASVWNTLLGVAVVLALIALPIIVVVRFVQDGTLLRQHTGILTGGVVVAGLLAFAVWYSVERRQRKTADTAVKIDGDAAHGSSGLYQPERSMGSRIWNVGVLILLLAVGALLPATWIYFGTEFHTIATFEDGLTVQSEDAAEATWRSIQIVYVAVLVMLPAMLYFLFDRVHISSLTNQWSRDIFRLDRRVDTLAELDGRYGHKLAEATRHSPNSRRLAGSKRSPIIVATILFAVGWTLLVLPTRPRDTTTELLTERAQVAAAAASQAAEVAQDPDVDDEAAAAAADEAVNAAEVAQQAAAIATGGTASGQESDAAALAAAAASPEEAARSAVGIAEGAAQETALAEEASGGGRFQIIDPDPSAATAAFLGAYFFGLFAALRGFSRRDLRPKLYVSMAARVALTTSTAFLIVVVTPWGESPIAIALAFLAGITPLPIIGAVLGAPFRSRSEHDTSSSGSDDARDAVAPDVEGEAPPQQAGAVAAGAQQGRSPRDGGPRDRFWRRWAASAKSGVGSMFESIGNTTHSVEKSLANRRPFTALDHVDLFESARLEAEGIPDVESLAHSEIVDLMVSTRIPATRLVDWVDQALLVLHVEGPDSPEKNGRLYALRGCGVRTATDLVERWDAARPSDPGTDDAESATSLDSIFEERAVFENVVEAIRSESNYGFVSCWRHNRLGDPDSPRMVIRTDGTLDEYVGLQETARRAVDDVLHVVASDDGPPPPDDVTVVARFRPSGGAGGNGRQPNGTPPATSDGVSARGFSVTMWRT